MGVHANDVEVVLLEAVEKPPFESDRAPAIRTGPVEATPGPRRLGAATARATYAFQLAAASTRVFRARSGTKLSSRCSRQTGRRATDTGASVFELDYVRTPVDLAQSTHFCKQMLVGIYERVFEVGPVFRAEPHHAAAAPEGIRLAGL